MIRAAGISNEDWASCRSAAAALEHPSLAARLTSVIGTPIEEGLKMLPANWYERVSDATDSVILRTLDVAVSTLPREAPDAGYNRHRSLGVATGAVGGFFGLPGLLVELPLTTMLMLRAIASIAASEGEDLNDLDARLACLEVFALGGPSASDEAAETGYYSLRIMMAHHFSVVSEAVARSGLAVRQIPGVVNLVRAIAARFGIAMSDKAAFQIVPVFGAAGGALINTIFMDHFQKMASGHFTVRRLERKYGRDSVRLAYESVAANVQHDADIAAQPASRPG